METEECPISKISAVQTNLKTSTITKETEVGKTTSIADISEGTSKETVTTQATDSIIATKKLSDKLFFFVCSGMHSWFLVKKVNFHV